MGSRTHNANRIVAAIFAALFIAVWISFPLAARGQTPNAELDGLFERLQAPGAADWQTVEAEIWRQWSRSGSPAMDLLLERGRQAIQEGDFQAAIEHLTALVDHAPDFAEGWNARATAYFQAGLYGPSLADIERVLALEPRHFGALSGLAMILEEIGRPAQALEAWRAAHAIHPNAPGINEALQRLERQVSGTDI